MSAWPVSSCRVPLLSLIGTEGALCDMSACRLACSKSGRSSSPDVFQAVPGADSPEPGIRSRVSDLSAKNERHA